MTKKFLEVAFLLSVLLGMNTALSAAEAESSDIIDDNKVSKCYDQADQQKVPDDQYEAFITACLTKVNESQKESKKEEG